MRNMLTSLIRLLFSIFVKSTYYSEWVNYPMIRSLLLKFLKELERYIDTILNLKTLLFAIPQLKLIITKKA